ncbi:MAG: disulfide bond formation protein B [Candidatus Peribacteraceae bacterium]|jgi:disulfide bond formation protein DsbB
MFLSTYTPQLVTALAVLTVAGQAISLALLALLLQRVLKKGETGEAFLQRHGLLLMFIVALIATGGSLFFSEVAGWSPCKLCWFQRIFLYPQALLLAVALWRKDRNVAWYVLFLSEIGLLFSVAHYVEQVQASLLPFTGDPLKPCDASGISCARTEITFAFGYITLPLMALTASLMNILTSVLVLWKKR